MRAVRSVLFLILFYVWGTFFALSTLPLLLVPRRVVIRSWRIWVGVFKAMLLVLCGVRIEVRGLENMPSTRALIAPKHQSMLDVFAQFLWLPDACFVAKRELMLIPVFGWYILKAGMIVVDRKGHAAALRKLVADAKIRFADDRQLIIFPEGHRGEPGVPGDYKPGIAAMYRELDVPVVPVATNSGAHWPRKGWLTPGTIVFEYLEPIPPGLKRAEFMRILQERIETRSIELLAF